MSNDRLEYQKNILGHIFRASNALQVFLDRQLVTDGLTAKQLFLMIVVGTFGDQGPTFKEAAEMGGSSYQNVKQLGLKLQKEGYIRIVNDAKDARAKRLILTQKAKEYWSGRDSHDKVFIKALFRGFNAEELSDFMNYLIRLEKEIERDKL